jgi:hypothetical protein
LIIPIKILQKKAKLNNINCFNAHGCQLPPAAEYKIAMPNATKQNMVNSNNLGNFENLDSNIAKNHLL